jgi:aldose 1-epimerase
MSSSQQFCFTHSQGNDIYLYTLRNSNGTEVKVSNYGAIINSFSINQADGSFNDIVLGFDKMEDYFSDEYLKGYPWMGCAVGRYANRIKNGKIKINEKEYQLSQNKGVDQLHGGINGFDRKVWQLVSLTDYSLTLQYNSPDGEEGYPGNLEVTIRFELTDEDELSYEFNATTDQATIINLTHHSYFNLNNGKGTIDDHKVKINASKILVQDEGLVCNGETTAVEGTIFDHRNFRAIGKKWEDKEIHDQSYVIDDKTKELRLAAEAISEQSKLHLQVYTTEPIVHFYSGKWIPQVKGKNGNNYGACSGFCLETHIHPNAINIPHFPNTVLRPGEKYVHKTMYKITSL